MTTVLQVISDALMEIQVIGETDAVSSEQLQHGLRTLNRMIQTWNSRKDIGLTDFATTNQAVAPAFEEALILNLAIRLAPSYEKQPNPTTVALAGVALRELRRVFANVPLMKQPHTSETDTTESADVEITGNGNVLTA